jgi:uncharacterized membrane protein
MILAASIIWQSSGWVSPAIVFAVLLFTAVCWSYWQSPGPGWVRLAAATIKLMAIGLLIICLLQPLLQTTRPRPGANLFLVVSDVSRSMNAVDPKTEKSRSRELVELLRDKSDWMVRLEQDFDVRRYTFGSQLSSVPDFKELTFSGYGSAIATSLGTLHGRFADRPVAGILLLTDGNATDHGLPTDLADFPPIYPVVIGSEQSGVDISVTRVTASEANFQVAPVSVLATIMPRGTLGKTIVIQVVTLDGEVLAEKTRRDYKTDEPQHLRFRVKPPETGLSFLRVQCYLQSEMGDEETVPTAVDSSEITLENNHRLFRVDQGGGPFRVLYVSGRPNWEFKFLRRATDDDDEVRLAALIRIAKKEAKFDFRGHLGETTNPLYRGIDEQNEEDVEQYDQAVILRIGVEDKDELRSGFPIDAEALYPFHAVILDDIEAKFFREDQMSLLQEFVSQRGGGLLMLGGQESFVLGGYRRTPIGELLPVYLEDRFDGAGGTDYRYELSRDGWLQPWVRLRDQEDDERIRINQMPTFRVFNSVSGVKPGASVLAMATPDGFDEKRPALVSQRFGKGRAAALMLGDLWRWGMHRSEGNTDDLENAWRQIIRWLVADVPQRVELSMAAAGVGNAVDLQIVVRDQRFEAEDNARLVVKVIGPDNSETEIDAQPSDLPGQYTARFVPHDNGPYRVQVSAADADKEVIGEREGGWVSQPAADEFMSLTPNTSLLHSLAESTDGEVVEAANLDRFVASLPSRKIPITEPWISPLWQQVPVFLLAIILLVGEWALRRTYGMA